MTNTMLRGLYVITDPVLCDDALVEKVTQALLGGARIVQYRNKQATAAQRLQQARALHSLCQKHRALFIVNDDVALAKQIKANGLHIGQSDIPVTEARAQLGPQIIIGMSCHNSLAAAIRAQAQGADYVAFGRFFSSRTKPEAPAADMATLTQAHQQLDIPLVAIGGINPENAQALIHAGADMLAVIHAIFGQTNIQQAAQHFTNMFNTPTT